MASNATPPPSNSNLNQNGPTQGPSKGLLYSFANSSPPEKVVREPINPFFVMDSETYRKWNTSQSPNMPSLDEINAETRSIWNGHPRFSVEMVIPDTPRELPPLSDIDLAPSSPVRIEVDLENSETNTQPQNQTAEEQEEDVRVFLELIKIIIGSMSDSD
jgi:hypothetical protein